MYEIYYMLTEKMSGATVPIVSMSYSSTLNLEAVRYSKMQIDFYRTIRGYTPQDSILKVLEVYRARHKILQ